jgi:hypothetical protein
MFRHCIDMSRIVRKSRVNAHSLASRPEQSRARVTRVRPVPAAWGHAVSPCLRCLLTPRRLVIFLGRSSIPGGRCSQGGVKIPTGGKGDLTQARERLLPPGSFLWGRRVSRFGAIPKPTVIVRMKENGLRRPSRVCAWADVVPYALILVLKEESHESDVARA